MKLQMKDRESLRAAEVSEVDKRDSLRDSLHDLSTAQLTRVVGGEGYCVDGPVGWEYIHLGYAVWY